MKWGDEFPRAHDLSSLRLLGTVGEPINPEAWVWYWQAHRRRPLPGRRHVVADRDRRHHDQPAARRDHAEARAARRSRCPASAPTSSTTPASRSASRAAATSCSTRPWPSMLRGIWGDPERYRDTYWIALRRQVLRGRRRQARRRRLLLAARPGRRHHARVGPQHLDHRGRVRARRPPRGRRGRGRRQDRRHDRPGRSPRS